LFRALFRGCDDVRSRLWTNTTTGRTGYAPACANEWVRGVWFFEAPVAASAARKMACFLTQTMSRRHQTGLDSYDPLFPRARPAPSRGEAARRRVARRLLGADRHARRAPRLAAAVPEPDEHPVHPGAEWDDSVPLSEHGEAPV